jgi:hypothetical protein
MDEGQGSTARDYSGNGNHGTLTNMDPDTDWVTGKNNGALDFDGSNDYVNCGTLLNTNLVRSKNFSVGGWIKTSGSSAMQIVTNSDWDNPWTGIEFVVNSNGTLTFDLNQDGSHLIRKTTSATVNNGIWHQVLVSYDGSGSANGVKIYIDSTNVSASTNYDSITGDSVSVTNLQIGARDGANSPFIGQIDDVRIYNYALSAEQVKQVMNEGAVRFK